MIKKLFQYSIYLFAFSLSFDPDWSSKTLILTSILGLFNLKLDKALFKTSIFKLVIALLLYTIINMCFITGHINTRQLFPIGLIILLFMIWTNTQLIKTTKNRALIFFSYGVYLVGIMNLMVLLVNYDSFSGATFFNTWESIRIIDIHKIYYAIYLNMAYMISMRTLYRGSLPRKYLVIFFNSVLTALLLYFTGSASGIIIFVILTSVFFISLIRNSMLNYFLPILLIVPCLIMFLLSFSQARLAFSKLDGEGSRVRNYEINQELFLKKPIFGYGIGNERLVMQTARNKNSWEFKNNYHAHNQYFEFLIGGGIALTILFLTMLVLLYKEKGRHMLTISFLIIILYSFLIESILLRHHGIIFFSFFFTLCFSTKINKQLNLNSFYLKH